MKDRVRRYKEATARLDFAALGALRHPDFECTYPQSGERFVGHANWVGAHVDYESHFGSDHLEGCTVKGGEQKVTVSNTVSPLPFTSTPIVQVSDTGDFVALEGVGVWPDGKTYYWVQLLEYREGLVWRETNYFAEPFEAPDWRRPFTEPIRPNDKLDGD